MTRQDEGLALAWADKITLTPNTDAELSAAAAVLTERAPDLLAMLGLDGVTA